MAMQQRDALLTSLWNRAYLAALSRDPGALLEDGAVRDAQQLAAAADPATDLPVAHVLGWYWWLRHLARPAPHGEQDLGVAMRLLGPVFQVSPHTVPQPLQRWYLQAEANSLASRQPPGAAGPAWQQHRRAERLPIFHGVVRWAVDAIHRGPRGGTERLLDFAMSLRGVGARGGDEAVLDEAAEVALAALGGIAGNAPIRAEPDRAFTPEAFLERLGRRGARPGPPGSARLAG